LTEKEDKAIREWLVPFAQFIKGEEVSWGTEDVTQFRQLAKDGKVEVVEDPYWSRLMETAAVLKQVVEQEGGVIETFKELTVGKEVLESRLLV
jgi:hypothetical protein